MMLKFIASAIRLTTLGSIKIRGVKVAGIDGRTSKRRPRTPVQLSDGGRFRRLNPRILMLPLLDRLTHHVHILEMNGQSFRLNHSCARYKGSTT